MEDVSLAEFLKNPGAYYDDDVEVETDTVAGVQPGIEIWYYNTRDGRMGPIRGHCSESYPSSGVLWVGSEGFLARNRLIATWARRTTAYNDYVVFAVETTAGGRRKVKGSIVHIGTIGQLDTAAIEKIRDGGRIGLFNEANTGPIGKAVLDRFKKTAL